MEFQARISAGISQGIFSTPRDRSSGLCIGREIFIRLSQGKPKNIGMGSLSFSSGILSDPGIELGPLHWQADYLPTEPISQYSPDTFI